MILDGLRPEFFDTFLELSGGLMFVLRVVWRSPKGWPGAGQKGYARDDINIPLSWWNMPTPLSTAKNIPQSRIKSIMTFSPSRPIKARTCGHGQAFIEVTWLFGYVERTPGIPEVACCPWSMERTSLRNPWQRRCWIRPFDALLLENSSQIVKSTICMWCQSFFRLSGQ